MPMRRRVPHRTAGFGVGFGTAQADIIERTGIETAQGGALTMQGSAAGGQRNEAGQATALGGKGKIKNGHKRVSMVNVCDANGIFHQFS